MHVEPRNSVSAFTESIDIIYEKELQFMCEHDKKLSVGEKSQLVEKFEKLTKITNLVIRSGENVAEVEIHSKVFQNLKANFVKDCALFKSTFILNCL